MPSHLFHSYPGPSERSSKWEPWWCLLSQMAQTILVSWSSKCQHVHASVSSCSWTYWPSTKTSQSNFPSPNSLVFGWARNLGTTCSEEHIFSNRKASNRNVLYFKVEMIFCLVLILSGNTRRFRHSCHLKISPVLKDFRCFSLLYLCAHSRYQHLFPLVDKHSILTHPVTGTLLELFPWYWNLPRLGTSV